MTTLNKRVIILGGGGHAGVLIEILRMLNIKIIGVADPNLSRESVVHGGIPVIGCDEAVMRYTPDETMLVNGMGPAHKNSNREVLSKKFISAGHNFLTLVHPQAYVSPSAQISPYNDPSIILSDPKYRTLFVGDLPHGLTADEFQPYFEQFGKI